MVEAIIKDQRRIFPVCIQLKGEYGIDNCYLGVPVVLGKNGIEKIFELQLNDAEAEMMKVSEGHVREVMIVLDDLNRQ
jgi:malate dehydrogenase